jgi:fatty acid desaturase
VIPQREVAHDFISGKVSDIEGFKQLCFHIGCASISASMIARGLHTDGVAGWIQFFIGELMLALCASFYFAAFHEMIHGSAFASKALADCMSHALGFATFRGSNWYYFFHWHHHRFTNDPERDPELSGETIDRADPTGPGALKAMALFLSGYPFGFERIPNMLSHAIGSPPPESWIDSDYKKAKVRVEYSFYCIGYLVLALAALERPSSVGHGLWYYWILPHMLGAGHLRYYQTAEHRGCQQGSFTDTNAWVVSRTTLSWWLYTKLAWNMPYHQEHHAWPNVPFYLLPELHRRVVASGARPISGCNPDGDFGYLWIQRVQWRAALNAGKKAAKAA